jgi:hypothetical protein
MTGPRVTAIVMLAGLAFFLLVIKTAPPYHPQPTPDLCNGPLKYAQVCSPWWFTP